MKTALTEILYRKIGRQSKATTLPPTQPSGVNRFQETFHAYGAVYRRPWSFVFTYNFFNDRYASGIFMDKAKRDEVVLVDDPAMAAAFRKARETLPEFLALGPRPAVDRK